LPANLWCLGARQLLWQQTLQTGKMRGTVAHAHMHTRLQPDRIWRGSLVLPRSVRSSGSVLRKEVARGVNVCLCASACGENVSTPRTCMHARISNTLGDNNDRGDGISLVHTE